MQVNIVKLVRMVIVVMFSDTVEVTRSAYFDTVARGWVKKMQKNGLWRIFVA